MKFTERNENGFKTIFPKMNGYTAFYFKVEPRLWFRVYKIEHLFSTVGVAHIFVLHISFSALFGAIAFEIMYQEGIPFHWAGAICGMSGWLGTRVIRIAQIILAKKFGLNQEVFKDIER